MARESLPAPPAVGTTPAEPSRGAASATAQEARANAGAAALGRIAAEPPGFRNDVVDRLTAFGSALTLPASDLVGRLAALNYAGEENTAHVEKGVVERAIHARHDSFAGAHLSPAAAARPIPAPSIPERFVRGNLLEKTIAQTEPLYFDTGPYNIKAKTAMETEGATTRGELQHLVQGLLTDQGSAQVVSQLVSSAQGDLCPFIGGRPVQEQVQIVTAYLREGAAHFWELRGLTRAMVEKWRGDPAGFRLPSGEAPHVEVRRPINAQHMKQVEEVERATRSHRAAPPAELLYLGLGEPDNAKSEAGALRQATHGAVETVMAPVASDAGAAPTPQSEKQFLTKLGIPAALQQRVLATMSQGTLARQDGMTHALIEKLWHAEQGQAAFDRVVVSAHSDGAMLWGVWDNGSILEDDLAQLIGLFPGACSQVHHVMVSACNNGWKANVAYYRKLFPNLRSYWSYLMRAPASETGSLAHLRTWERSTAPGATGPSRDLLKGPLAGSAGLPVAMRVREAYDYVRSQFTDAPAWGVVHADNVAIWTVDHGYQSGDSEQGGHDAIANVDGYRSASYGNPRWHAAYDAAFAGTIPSPGSDRELLAYTEAMEREMGNDASLTTMQREDLRVRQAKLLLLRNWSSVAAHFGTAYGSHVLVGIAKANELDHGARAVPAWTHLSRGQALALARDLDAVQAAHPSDPELRRAAVFARGLADVDLTIIEESWA